MTRQDEAAKLTPPGKSPLTIKWLLCKGLAAALLYFGAAPVFLLPGAFLLPQQNVLIYVLPGTTVCLAYLAGIFSGRWRRLFFLAALFAQAAICTIALLPLGPWKLLYILPCLFLMLLFMPAMNRPSFMEWPPSMLGFGILAHLLGQILKGVNVFEPFGPSLNLFFSGYLLICLFLFNRYALAAGMQENVSPPKKLLSKNQRILTVFGVLGIIAACFRELRTVVEAALLWLRDAFFALLGFLASLLPDLSAAKDQGAQGTPDLQLPKEAQEPGWLAVLLEKIFYALGLIIAALLIGFALYHLAKLVKKAIARLISRIRDYSKSLGEGYSDKAESLLDLGEMTRTAREKWEAMRKRLSRPPNWDRVSPREQVRRVVAVLLFRSHSVDPASTLREAIQSGQLQVSPVDAQDTADLYEKARYSSLPIKPEEAQSLRQSAGL